jgi:Zn-dependent peptidase ImmA (M78 family)/transcriptional regulator with XRE-family HTH domain
MNSTSSSNQDISPQVVGSRLQEARKARGLTQQYAAEALGMSRPTYVAIEKGERVAQPQELIRLAELYGRTIHELLRQRPPIRDFVPHFRAAATEAREGTPDLDKAAALLQQLSDDYVELEQLCRTPLPRNYPAVYDISGLDPTEAAEQVAAAERNRLGLGDGPVANLRELLETDVGLRIFHIELPVRISGLFIFTEELGACIAVERRHPAGRRLWSLCHEYAHFLVHRYEAEVTVLRADSHGSRKERFADSFAKAFLMPGLGLRRRFNDLLRSAGQITPAALITLADLYGGSFEALLLRLEDLCLLPVGTWHRLKGDKFRVKEAQQMLGVGPGTGEPMLPRRFMSLAVRAYEAESLSEGELVEVLHTDRQQARQIVQELTTRSEVTEEGEAGQLHLDLAVPLVGLKGTS